MNTKIRKLVQKSRKHFFRSITLRRGDDDDIKDLLKEFGLYVYEDPSDADMAEGLLLVSNRPLTYGWYIKWYEASYDGNPWARDTFGHENPTDELETD